MKIRFLVLTIAMTIAMSVPTLAGSWEQANGIWKYKNDNGTYSANTWQWIDGKCYCFDKDGNMYANITTPDGYTVNSDGQWTVNGVIQTQSAAGSTTAASSTNDRLYYLNRWYGLPGESQAVKDAKMRVAIAEQGWFTDLGSTKYPRPKTYEELKKFLTSIDWPNMSEMNRLDACFKRVATGYNGNYYSTSTFQDLEDVVLVHKTGICQDYSKALKTLCKLVGLEAYEDGRVYVGLGHEIVKVKIDGTWYSVDPTWAEGQALTNCMYRFDDPKVNEIYGASQGLR